MKTILILGGYGFIGTNIIKYIEDNLTDQYNVIVFDRFPSNRAGLSLRCVKKTYSGDFSDSLMIEQIFAENSIDLVIHSLSTTIPALSPNARFDIETNLIPTVELLDCMVRHNVLEIVYISSGGAIYGDSTGRKHKETDDVFPISSYGIIKLAIEKYLMQYAALYNLKPLILRLSNPFGPYHYSKRQGICNVALDAALSNEPFVVWGSGSARKDYICINDFVHILFRLISSGVGNKVINVASGNLASVDEILQIIKDFIPSFRWSYAEASKYDVANFELDTDLLHSLIGDYQFVGIREGIKQLLDRKDD